MTVPLVLGLGVSLVEDVAKVIVTDVTHPSQGSTMTAPAPSSPGGTTPGGLAYPAITGPKTTGVPVADVAALAAEGIEDLAELIIKDLGPTATSVVTSYIGALPGLVQIILDVREPLNGKNLQRVAAAQAAYGENSAAGLAFLIGRFNAEPLEPDYYRQLCEYYAICRGVPQSAFPS